MNRITELQEKRREKSYPLFQNFRVGLSVCLRWSLVIFTEVMLSESESLAADRECHSFFKIYLRLFNSDIVIRIRSKFSLK